ncbi:sensor domain-containing diguanylate cyclase [Shewanella aestuarii]|uniref:diguanylate cyclase n=1 Tax=Shewanella aestuarii TaxID=1028752 RepID=A0A6G9QP05_9GAMM|nr:diguanylate cyclase [Shewanella aestuarii]QIR15823.1 diguanylate cyclase [Shewanella aestuarii]
MNQLSYKQLIALPVIIVILLIIYSSYLMSRQLEEYARFSHQEDQLLTLNHAVHYLENHGTTANIIQQINTISQITGKRLTLINLQGEVLADSALKQEEAEALENHGQRPEVLSVIQNLNSIGISWRYSNTLKTNLLYTTKSLQINNSTLLLRVAMPQTEVYQNLSIYRTLFYISGTIALLIVTGTGLLIAKYINRRIEEEHQVLERKVQERTQEISALNDISALFSACTDYEELYLILTSSCQQLFPKASGALAIYHSSKALFTNVTSWNLNNSTTHHTFSHDSCWALKVGRPYYKKINAIGCAHNTDHQLAANQLCIPLTARGETLGLLQLYSDEHNYLELNRTTLSTLGENLSLALAGLILLDELRTQALHDPLTGLFNRRHLDEALKSEVSPAKRNNTQLATMMIDADHFKRYNDIHGHDAGDYVLQALSKSILEILRSEDIACRYGGEEFVILLPQTSQQDSIEIAKRLRRVTRNTSLQFKGKTLPNLSLSIGITIFPTDSATENNILKQADAAMYHAKQHGRDQIVCYGDIQT